MTREEQLDWLCRLRSEIYVYMPKEWLISMNNALDMAIKDLEQKSTIKNDLGVEDEERTLALMYLKQIKDDYIDGVGYERHPLPEYYAIETAIKLLELPSVTPQEPRWIPVTERLPDKDGEYLLFGKISEDEDNYIFVGEYDSCGEQFGIWQEQFDRATLGCLGSEFYEYSSVIAWQPLPKPYKESEVV